MNILIGFLTAVHILVAVFLIVLVLMQKSKDQGVGAAFGGGMTETVFGANTTTALVRMTIWCACILLATSLVLATLHARRHAGGGGSLMEGVRPSAPAAPATLPVLPAPEQPAAPAAPPPTTPPVESSQP